KLKTPRDAELRLTADGQPSGRAWHWTLKDSLTGRSDPKLLPVAGIPLAGLGRDPISLWVAVFNPDPDEVVSYELILSAKPARPRRRVAGVRCGPGRGRTPRPRVWLQRGPAGHDQGARLARDDGGRSRRLSLGRRRARLTVGDDYCCCCWALMSSTALTARSGGRAGTSRNTGRSMWRKSSRSVETVFPGTTSVLTWAFSVSRATPR